MKIHRFELIDWIWIKMNLLLSVAIFRSDLTSEARNANCRSLFSCFKSRSQRFTVDNVLCWRSQSRNFVFSMSDVQSKVAKLNCFFERRKIDPMKWPISEDPRREAHPVADTQHWIKTFKTTKSELKGLVLYQDAVWLRKWSPCWKRMLEWT